MPSPPTAERIVTTGAFIKTMIDEGALIETGGLQHSSKGARVRINGGDYTVTDGPFAEAKELIGGYAIMHAASKGHAIALTKRFLAVVGVGETEIRLMHDPPAPDHR